MSIHVVVQPVVGRRRRGRVAVARRAAARCGGEGTTLLVQVPARIGGLSDTARFARSLAAAANEFGEWCETQNRTHSHSSPLPERWPNVRLNSPSLGDENSGLAVE